MENSYELIFFLFKQHCGKAWGRCYLGIPGILGLSPDSSLTGFFRFSIWRRENGAEWQGASGKGGRCSIFRTEQSFYYHRASNDRSVLSQSITIFMFSRGYKSFPGEVLPYKRLMVMRRWMGSHCHVWIDYNGVAFSMESLEWRRTFSDFWGKKKFFTFTVSKRTRMFVL